MSRFVDITSTRVISTSCGCKGKPHTEDQVEILAEVPYGVIGLVTVAGYADDPNVFNRVRANAKLLELTVKSWNLFGPNGREWPVDSVTVGLLDATTTEWIAREVNKGYKPAKLPKDSPAPSANGSSETTSPAPASAATTTSTTSS